MVSRRCAPIPLLLGLIAVLVAGGAAAAQQAAPIAPAVSYQHIYRPEGPWAVHVVEADLSDQHLELAAVLAGGATMDRRPLSEIATAHSSEARRLVAAVNGDFFALAGGAYATIPLGLQVEGRELLTFPDPSRSVLYRLADGRVGIERFRARAWMTCPGDVLFPIAAMNRPPGYADLVLFTPRFGAETRAAEGTLHFALVGLSGPVRPNANITARVAAIATAASAPIPPDGAALAARGVAAYALRGLKIGDEVRLRLAIEPAVGDIVEAVSGGPRLVRDGQVSVETRQERFAERFASARHPRTGVGIRGSHLVLAAVDGRQPGYSEGMSLPEFAELFLSLGCTDALNLDGGGSTTMVVRDRVVNSPSSGVERAIVNALAIFSTAPPGPPARLSVEPAELSILSGEEVVLQARALDEYYNPVPLEATAVMWACPRGVGEVDASGLFRAAKVEAKTVGMVIARLGEMTASAVVRVLPTPAHITVAPAEVAMAPGATQRFVAQAHDAEGRPIPVPPERVFWSVHPQLPGASVTRDGLFTAPPRQALLTVAARVQEAVGSAQVMVGAVTTVIEDFEREGPRRFRTVPAGLPGSVAVVDDPLRPGNRCLRLSYDLSQGEGTRAAYADLDLTLPESRSLAVRVLGDGQGVWLRARLRDGAGRTFTLDLAQRVVWSGQWRQLSAWLPEEAEGPVVLESIYVVEIRDDRKPAGEIHLDDIAVAAVSSAGAPR